jgi:hypothetical protein
VCSPLEFALINAAASTGRLIAVWLATSGTTVAVVRDVELVPGLNSALSLAFLRVVDEETMAMNTRPTMQTNKNARRDVPVLGDEEIRVGTDFFRPGPLILWLKPPAPTLVVSPRCVSVKRNGQPLYFCGNAKPFDTPINGIDER